MAQRIIDQFPTISTKEEYYTAFKSYIDDDVDRTDAVKTKMFEKSFKHFAEKLESRGVEVSHRIKQSRLEYTDDEGNVFDETGTIYDTKLKKEVIVFARPITVNYRYGQRVKYIDKKGRYVRVSELDIY